MDLKLDLFKEQIVAVNVGMKGFGQALEQQGVQVIYVDWSPPAGGYKEIMDFLDELL